MKMGKRELNDSQKEVILELHKAMENLFLVFVEVDKVDLSITDALEEIGMEVPTFAKPAVNQLSGKLRQMRREDLGEERVA